jgi:preprotein translocase subunit Sec61beta
MTDLLPVLSRIFLRYLAGALVAFGMIGPEDAQIITMDPDLALVVGAVLGVVVEGAYTWARRHGGAT